MALMDFLNKRNKNSEDEMSFIDHLEVLRWHLIRSVIAVVVGAIVVFIFTDFFVDDIVFGPTKSDFVSAEWMCKLGHMFGAGDSLCFKDVKTEFIETTMTGQFIANFTVAFIGGFVIAFPYIFWEIWRFVKPALSKKEGSHATGIIFWVSLLFFIGVAFGYFILMPLMVQFYFNYTLSSKIKIMPTFSDYLENLTYTTVGVGLLFQLPLLILLLARAGIVTSAILRKFRRHAFVVILIAAAIITPTTDPFSPAVVAAPLYLLFEISIGLAARGERKNLEQNPEEWS